MVGGADRVAAGWRRGANAHDQYDADAAARGVARMYSASADGRISAHGRSHADAALAADDGGRALDRRIVDGVSGRAQHLYRGREEICGGAGRQGGCRFRACLSCRGIVGGERAARRGEGGACRHSSIRLYQLCRICRLRLDRAGGGGRAGGRDCGIRQDRGGLAGLDRRFWPLCCSRSC